MKFLLTFILCRVLGWHRFADWFEIGRRPMADVVSDIRPTIILRRLRLINRRECRRCGHSQEITRLLPILPEDPWRRAPGEEGLRLNGEPNRLLMPSSSLRNGRAY